MEKKQFELELRTLIDGMYDREVEPGNVFHDLIEGKLPREQCLAIYMEMMPSLMVFNQVLLPRLLEKAPDLPTRVRLMHVIAQEYGPNLDIAHPCLFKELVVALGAPSTLSLASSPDGGAAAAEAKLLRSWSFIQLLARMLVGESLGPVCFPAIAEALQTHYGVSEIALSYFSIHATTDKRDAEILFELVREHAHGETGRAEAVAVIRESFEFGRYKMYGCKLPNTQAYRYVRRFDRRSLEVA